MNDRERIDSTAVTAGLEGVRDHPEAVPSPGMLADMSRIAGEYGELVYDANADWVWVLAVRRAAVASGLALVPDYRSAAVVGYHGRGPVAGGRR